MKKTNASLRPLRLMDITLKIDPHEFFTHLDAGPGRIVDALADSVEREQLDGPKFTKRRVQVLRDAVKRLEAIEKEADKADA